jgi:fido (protein-threonine AMPylation protein)
MKQEDLPKGATPLDNDELEGLKIKTITTRSELDRWEQQNIGDAMDWLENRKNKSDILNEGFIRKLHEKMLGKVWEWAGSFRKTDKNIGLTTKLMNPMKSLYVFIIAWFKFIVFRMVMAGIPA